MTHVITQACCNDASCVVVCPADAIHPGPHELSFAAVKSRVVDAPIAVKPPWGS